MLDVAVTKVSLKRSRVVALIGERVAAGVPQHVGMGLEGQLGCDTRPLDHPSEASRREWRTTLGREHGDLGSCSRWSRRRARSCSRASPL